jgi:hypothetical protein
MHIDPEQPQTLLEHQEAIAQRLRDLPHESTQPYDWAEFRRRAHRRAASSRPGMSRRHAALAAAILLVVAGIAVWTRVTRPNPTPRGVALSQGDPRSWGRGESTNPTSGMADVRSAAAEHWLASLPNDPPVVRVGTRAAVAGLEDRIAQLDDLLSEARVEGTQPASLVALQEQRARLVRSLAQVRYAETLVYESR